MQLDYPFEEVPLCKSEVAGKTYEGGFVGGLITVKFDRSGSWSFGDVNIECANYTRPITTHLNASEPDLSHINDAVASRLRQDDEAGDADARIDAMKEAVA